MSRTARQLHALPLALTTFATVWGAGALAPVSASAAGAKATKTQIFKGPVEYVDHGPVQVSIAVKGKRITAVKVKTSPEEARSVVIQGNAVPLLKEETLRAQSANIDGVSGATDTSQGYVASLQAAIKAARQHKALR